MTQLTMDHLIDGAHEKCAWCRTKFTWTKKNGWSRFKALDGKFYCSETHASAPYLKPRNINVALWQL